MSPLTQTTVSSGITPPLHSPSAVTEPLLLLFFRFVLLPLLRSPDAGDDLAHKLARVPAGGPGRTRSWSEFVKMEGNRSKGPAEIALAQKLCDFTFIG